MTAPNFDGPPPLVLVRAYLRIAALWKLSDEDAAELAGLSGIEQLTAFRSEDISHADTQVHLRLAHVLGVYGALIRLFGNTEAADQWIKAPNAAALFRGCSALSYMLDGGLTAIMNVQRHLTAQ